MPSDTQVIFSMSRVGRIHPPNRQVLKDISLGFYYGAKTRAIRMQFIAEALTLSMIGGLAGILAGVGASKAISALAGWSTVISPFSIVLAFGFSAIVGIFFGYYPAYKASLLDPILALHYE